VLNTRLGYSSLGCSGASRFCLSRIIPLFLMSRLALSHGSCLSLSHESSLSLSQVLSLSLTSHVSVPHGSSLSLSWIKSLSLTSHLSLSLSRHVSLSHEPCLVSRIAQQVVGTNANESRCIGVGHVSSEQVKSFIRTSHFSLASHVSLSYESCLSLSLSPCLSLSRTMSRQQDRATGQRCEGARVTYELVTQE